MLRRGPAKRVGVDKTQLQQGPSETKRLIRVRNALYGRSQLIVVDDTAANQPAGQALAAGIRSCASDGALRDVHHPDHQRISQVEAPGLLREAEQLEDVGEAEGIERTLELHVTSRLDVGR